MSLRLAVRTKQGEENDPKIREFVLGIAEVPGSTHPRDLNVLVRTLLRLSPERNVTTDHQPLLSFFDQQRARCACPFRNCSRLVVRMFKMASIH
jgi:hypothetical protein